MGYSAARSVVYGHRLVDVFILYHKRTFLISNKWLSKGLSKGFRGYQGGAGGCRNPTSEQAGGEPITPPYLQLKLSIAKRCGLWYNESAV